MGYNWRLYTIIIITNFLSARSVYRSIDPYVPCVKVSCANSVHTFYDSHLKKIIFDLYDDVFFKRHLLPMQSICFRNTKKKSVQGHTLSSLVQRAVTLIKNNVTKAVPLFEDFIVLKARDINKQCNAGSFILKFKDYPFVVKIFVSSPSELLRCDNKGFEQRMLYYISGGTTRHLMGLTRIKNMEYVRSMTAQHSYWSQRLSFPRKWFWLPKNPSFLIMHLNNMNKNAQSVLPETYAIICDYIEWRYTFTIFNSIDRQEALALSNYLHHCIDSHINNFGVEKETNKLVIIDFEYFPRAIFNRTHSYTKNYTEWYKELILKALYELVGRQKYRRTIDFDKRFLKESKTICDY